MSTLLIKPNGFEITPAATGDHGISNIEAVAAGVPLRAALQAMMDDVLSCCQRGGRLADHYMGFDAGIIMEELNRAGLGHLQQRWEMAVRSGICTMDPDLACWVRKAYEIRDAYGLEIPREIPMRLLELFKSLVRNNGDVTNSYCNAAKDALMCWQVCSKLAAQCEAACVTCGAD